MRNGCLPALSPGKCQSNRTFETADYRDENMAGQEYHTRSEQQIIGYLEDYHKNKGYMLSFCFNKKKTDRRTGNCNRG